MSHDLINLVLDGANTPVDRRLRHIELFLDLHNRVVLYPEVKHVQLLRGKIALSPKPLTLRLRELGFNVQRQSPLFSPNTVAL